MWKDKIMDILMNIMKIFPIKRNRCLLYSSYGTNYGCNPKYISKKLVENYKELEVVWVLNNPENYSIAGVKIIKNMSLNYFYNLATSKVIVTNFRTPRNFKKRKNQKYIQTWHSSLRLKQIEKDAENSLPKEYLIQSKEDSKKIDYLLSGCKYSTDIFKRAFWYEGEILEVGTPRNDFIFNMDEKNRLEIKKELGLKESDKVLLYAPTFRKNNNLDVYNIEYKKLLKSLEKRFNGEWKILMRLHPHLINISSQMENSNILDVTKYDDIQELLGITDILISDYSSLIFDFSITKKPCFLYVPDLKKYTLQERKLYFKIEDLPFITSLNNRELNDNISKFSYGKYEKGLKKFLKKIGSFEDGNASKKVAKLIKEICEEKK